LAQVVGLTLMTCAQEVLGSKLGRDAIITEVFVVFLSPSRKILESALKLGHDHFLQHPL
jgi:hypothetical protein